MIETLLNTHSYKDQPWHQQHHQREQQDNNVISTKREKNTSSTETFSCQSNINWYSKGDNPGR